MKKSITVFITETDHERLGHLINMVRNQHDRANVGYIKTLEEGIEYAEVVAPEDIPPDVVTMRSRVKLKDLDSGEESVYSIVFPTEANIDEGRISILAPLATALLGHKRGETVEFQAPSRLRRLMVEEILYQPESAGDYNL
jgi:regulator of nucleoside diphosphate kinase